MASRITPRRLARRRSAAAIAALVSGLIALVGTVNAVAVPSAAAFELRTITFYSGKNFTGQAYSFDLGAVPNINAVVPEPVLSARIGTATPVALYSLSAFTGSCVDLQGGIADLSATRLGALTVQSFVPGENCQPTPSLSDPNTPFLRLCEEANCPTSTTSVRRLDTRRDLPDLEKVGFDNRTTDVQLMGGLRAAALYTGVGYTGECETVVAKTLALQSRGGALVDDNTISSVRLDWTCYGPLTGPAVIRDIEFASSDEDDVRCPDRYSKLNTDLNEGVGGKFIFACVAYGPYVAGQPYVEDIYYLNSPTPVEFCTTNGELNGAEISSDLNEGFSGSDYIYACVKQAGIEAPTQRRTARSARVAAPLTDEVVDQLYYIYDTTMSADDAIILQSCVDNSSAVLTQQYSSANLTSQGLSLNNNQFADFDPIYDCTHRRTRTQADLSPVLQVPTSLRTNGSTVMFIARGYTPDGQALPLNCGAAESQGTSPDTLGGERYAMYDVPPGNYTLTCVATYTDELGQEHRTEKSFPVNVNLDETISPQLIASGISQGRTYSPGAWTNAPVTVTWSCFDPAPSSGIAVSSVPNQTVSDETPATGLSVTNTGTCLDRAGNFSSSVTFGPIRIDKTAPTVSPTVPSEGQVIPVGTEVTAEAVLTDALSGLATSSSPARQPLETTTLGEKTVTWTAVDLAGNQTTASRTYFVVEPEINTQPTLAPIADVVVDWSDRMRVVTASGDADGDPVTTQVAGLPPGLGLITTGRNAVIGGTVSAAPGRYPVVVTVEDGRGGQTVQRFVLRIKPEDARFDVAGGRSSVVRVPAGGAAVLKVVDLRDADDGSAGDLARSAPIVGKLVGRRSSFRCAVEELPTGRSYSFICKLGNKKAPVRPGDYTLTFTAGGFYRADWKGEVVVKQEG